MKAIRVHAVGGPEALRYEDVSQPGPGAGQVLVKVEAAGVNYIDVYQRNGMYQVATPFTLGQEAAGVGLLLCQVASRRGARVIGTVSTRDKAALARDAGARDVILYTEQDFEVEAKRLTGGLGLQVVYDSVGKTTFEKGLNCLTRRGMMVLYGPSSGPIGAFDPQVLMQKGSLFLTRPTIAHYIATRAELVTRAGEVLSWLKSGTLKVRIEHEFSLAEAAEAHRALEARKTTGKLLLIP